MSTTVDACSAVHTLTFGSWVALDSDNTQMYYQRKQFALTMNRKQILLLISIYIMERHAGA